MTCVSLLGRLQAVSWAEQAGQKPNGRPLSPIAGELWSSLGDSHTGREWLWTDKGSQQPGGGPREDLSFLLGLGQEKWVAEAFQAVGTVRLRWGPVQVPGMFGGVQGWAVGGWQSV